jgi:hypothetical protein
VNHEHAILEGINKYQAATQNIDPWSPGTKPKENLMDLVKVSSCRSIFSRLYGGFMVVLKMSSPLLPGEESDADRATRPAQVAVVEKVIFMQPCIFH